MTTDLISFYGLYRVAEPVGVGLQGALRVHAGLMDDTLMANELVLEVSLLELDSTSLRQIHTQVQQDQTIPADRQTEAMANIIDTIVKQRGKMHNPVTGSGGVMVGRVAQPPPATHPQFSALQAAFQARLRVIPLCSLTAIPLTLTAVAAPDLSRCQVPVQGIARLPPSVRIAILPPDERLMPTTVALQCIDISRLLPQLSKLLLDLPPAPTVAILGAGRAGLFAIALCRRQRPDATVVAFDVNLKNLHYASLLGALAIAVDLTSPVAILPHVAAHLRQGEGADLVLNCVNCRGTEDSSVFCCRALSPAATTPSSCPHRVNRPGVIAYFSMATDFTRACLATDPTGKCVDVIAGAGVFASQCEDAMALYFSTPFLQDFLLSHNVSPDVLAASDALWFRRPSPAEVQATQIVAFAHTLVVQDPQVRATFPFLHHFLTPQMVEEQPFAWYRALHQWSIAAPDQFWRLFWQFADLRATVPPRSYLASPSPVATPPRLTDYRFFQGAQLNHAANLLRFAQVTPTKTALSFRSEDPARCPSRSLSFAQLQAASLHLAAWLQHAPHGPRLRTAAPICAVMPNSPETVMAMLAVTSFGGVFAACSPDMGAKVLISRLGQIQPTVLFVSPQYLYNGKIHDCSVNIAALIDATPSVQHIVLLPHLDSSSSSSSITPRDGWQFMTTVRSPPLTVAASTRTVPITQLCEVMQTPLTLSAQPFLPLTAQHPVYILFTSGTTGLPKCIAQGIGVLVNHLKEQLLHCDLRATDKTFCYTSTAWMLWHWLVSTLAIGCTVQLYDGSPSYPDGTALWRLFQEEQVTYAGLSARFLSACLKEAVHDKFPLNATKLRLITSTGSPLQPAAASWVYRHISPQLRLCSLGGGTEINGCLALGCPVLPTPQSCELQCPPLGMDVGVASEEGIRVLPGTPLLGDLVCRNAFPSMPLFFLNDPDGKKYHDAYFERFGSDVWSHGDFAEATVFGGIIIHGRSDSTLNPGGVRLGTGDYYDVVEKIPSVVEAIVVGQKTSHVTGSMDGDERVVLFVKLAPHVQLDQALQHEIKSQIRTHLSPKHVPALIVQVQHIPVNANFKKLEILTRRAINGEVITPAMLQQLAMPHLLDEYLTFSSSTLKSFSKL